MKDIKWQVELAKALEKELATLKTKNSRFSMRAFAKKIGISPGALSGILSNKKNWNLTPERAKEIIAHLNISQAARNRLFVMIGEMPEHKEQELAVVDYNILTSWIYFPILFSFELRKDLSAPEKIAARLGIPVADVVNAISILVEKGLLKSSGDGVITREPGNLRTTDGVSSEEIRLFHELNLDLAKKALHILPVDQRDFCAFTFAGNSKQIDGLRKEIRNLVQKASSLMEANEENDNVFRLSVQLFPIDFS